MSESITVGLALAKNVFQAHAADVAGRAVLRKKLHRRGQFTKLFIPLPSCVVAQDACGGGPAQCDVFERITWMPATGPGSGIAGPPAYPRTGMMA